jgi:hypothetical protein
MAGSGDCVGPWRDWVGLRGRNDALLSTLDGATLLEHEPGHLDVREIFWAWDSVTGNLPDCPSLCVMMEFTRLSGKSFIISEDEMRKYLEGAREEFGVNRACNQKLLSFVLVIRRRP